MAQKFAGKCGEARRVFALSADTFKDSCDRRCPRYYVDGHSHTDAESPVPRHLASRRCFDARRVAGAPTPGAPWQPRL